MSDEKLIINAEEAESLLEDGKYVHNFGNPAPNMLIGVDYLRDDAIAAFRRAKMIEIGGEHCKRMKHPIVVHDAGGRYSFFAADMERVEALEQARAPK